MHLSDAADQQTSRDCWHAGPGRPPLNVWFAVEGYPIRPAAQRRVMLGVRRSTVTVVAGGLQSAGLMSIAHGRVRVIDRRGLEKASCECYCLIREQFDRLACDTANSA